MLDDKSLPESGWKRHRVRAAIWFSTCALLAAAVWYKTQYAGDENSAVPGNFPLPPIAESQYLNTKADASYIGSERCIQCHADQHASYSKTGHSRAMAEIDLDREPADGELMHDLSGRRYQVERDGDALRHKEWLVRADGTEVPLSDYPVRYVVGSGRFAKTYLVEADGFLVESPLTWFAASHSWNMSPGYDAPVHASFHRNIAQECLLCHVGAVKTLDESHYRLQINELGVGCESCHGPSSLHEKRRQSDVQPKDSPDLTIVNPRHLPRELSEAICQQCHLNSDAQVPARGREAADFSSGVAFARFPT